MSAKDNSLQKESIYDLCELVKSISRKTMTKFNFARCCLFHFLFLSHFRCVCISFRLANKDLHHLIYDSTSIGHLLYFVATLQSPQQQQKHRTFCENQQINSKLNTFVQHCIIFLSNSLRMNSINP